MTPPGTDPTTARRFWLNLQVGLGLSGGAIWFAGVALEQDFVAGVGCGFIASALILRLGRGATRSPAQED